ncbi:MAG: substrate-binding domain-containing protein [Christensenellaceae bacterium]|jgi:ABC-type sugar transport system substrate-binding protein
MKIVRSNIFILIAIVAVFILILFVWTRYSTVPDPPALPENSLSIGIISTDAEDEWRAALIDQVYAAGTEKGFSIIRIETERTQSAQIDAIRALISYNVEVIVLCPVMERGWDYVIQEAKDGGVKIISLNEEIFTGEDITDNVMYVSYDYTALGTQTAKALADHLDRNGKTGLRAVELRGTVGSSVSDKISNGLRTALQDIDNFTMNYIANADNMRSRAKELIRDLLRSDRSEIDVIIAHNDGMALGALDAIKGFGLTPGKDILIVAFGGGDSVMQAYENGEILCVAQCDIRHIGERVIDQCINISNEHPMPGIAYGYSEVII